MTDDRASVGHAADRPVRAILGVVLAGGQSRRMGREKGLIVLGAKPLIQHAVDRLAPQVDGIIVNVNGDPARFGEIDVPVVPDTQPDYPGPLAGLLAAMRWAEKHAANVSHVATVPVDTPFFPTDLVARLRHALDRAPKADLAFAVTSEGPQPVFVLAALGLADPLERDMASGGARRVGEWLRSQRHVEVRFENGAAFFNANTPADLAHAEDILK